MIRCLENATLRRDSEDKIIGYQGIIRDITEESQAKEALLKTQKLESLGILAGGIAHDFNNLLMGVMGNASLAKQYLEPNSEIYELINDISSTSEKAANLTKQLLAYSGRAKFLIELQNISDLIEGMKEILRVSVHKSTDLVYSIDKKIPMAMIDKIQIEQVILNLVTNASEAIGESIGRIRISTITEFLDEEKIEKLYYAQDIEKGNYACICVEDTGSGMDISTLRRIFDPFFSTKFQGRGLGLAAVIGIIRGHNGCISVESAVGEGSIFKVYLPIPPQNNQKEISKAIRIEEEDWEGSGWILFCDDDEIVLSVGSHLLKQLGFHVIKAKNGIEALKLLDDSNEDIKLIILDMTMPKMSGRDTYLKIKEKYPLLKIVLSSGYSEESVKNQFENHKIDGFLQKPYTLETLTTILKSLIK